MSMSLPAQELLKGQIKIRENNTEIQLKELIYFGSRQLKEL